MRKAYAVKIAGAVFSFLLLASALSPLHAETKKAAIGLTLKVDGMVCSSCKKKVSDCLMKLKGIKKVSVDMDNNEARVEYEKGKVSVKDMVGALKKKGYDAKEITE